MLRSSLLFTVLLLATTSVSALTLSLSEFAPRVRQSHPSLKAARLAVDEARGRQLGAGRLANPTLGGEIQNESQVSPGSVGLSLDQAFPITKRLRLEKKLSAQWVEAAELEVRDAERLLSSQAQVLGVKLLAVRQQKALREQQVALAGKLSEFASRRAKDGEISALDAAQIEVDGQRLQLESRRLDTEAASLIGELKPLLGLQPEVPLEVTGELVEMNMPGASMAWKQRADYQLALKKAESTTTEIDLAKAKRYGDLSTGLFTASEWQRDSGNRENTGYVGLRVSIPWPLWNRNEGEIAEKTAGSKRAQLEAVAMAAQIVNEVDSARREMKAHADLLLESKGKLLPLLTDHAAKLEKAYQSGQADLIALERARDQRLQVESSTIDTLRDFHLARIRYETAIGKHATAAAKH